jgi:hypothetical protein
VGCSLGLEHGDIDREGGHPRAELNIMRQGMKGTVVQSR